MLHDKSWRPDVKNHGIYHAAALRNLRTDAFACSVGNSDEQRTLGILRRRLAESGN